MSSFNMICQKVEDLYKKWGMYLLLAGENNTSWIFKGTSLSDNDIEATLIVDKKSEDIRLLDLMNNSDLDIINDASLLIDNRSGREDGEK